MYAIGIPPVWKSVVGKERDWVDGAVHPYGETRSYGLVDGGSRSLSVQLPLNFGGIRCPIKGRYRLDCVNARGLFLSMNWFPPPADYPLPRLGGREREGNYPLIIYDLPTSSLARGSGVPHSAILVMVPQLKSSLTRGSHSGHVLTCPNTKGIALQVEILAILLKPAPFRRP